MLFAALTGALIGAGFAALFLVLVATGAERRAQGLVSTLGLIGLVAACLALDGWILAAIAGFVAAIALWAGLRGRLRRRPRTGGGGA